MCVEQITIYFAEDAIDIQSASELPAMGCGAECVFIGRTRPESNGQHGDLISLKYDCYQEMATNQLTKVAQEAIVQFGVEHIKITHSIGTVKIDEASVVIAVQCPHRDAAFSACRFLIDQLKEQVPIWKQEMWADGSTWADGAHIS
jgi:molybdopterin synthase catalytic subunit